jgi:hypothetical protein
MYVWCRIAMSMKKEGADSKQPGYRFPVAKLRCGSQHCLSVKSIEFVDCDSACVRQGGGQACKHRYALLCAIWWLGRDGQTANPTSIPAYYALPPASRGAFQSVCPLREVQIERKQTAAAAEAEDADAIALALGQPLASTRKKRERAGDNLDEAAAAVCKQVLVFPRDRLKELEEYGGYHTRLTRSSHLGPRELVAEAESRASSLTTPTASAAAALPTVDYNGAGEMPKRSRQSSK